jgi:hypothetical protein
VDRPGFERLVASVCAGDVGAVLCLDASRLSRNGRDWHHLLALCGLVQARVIDAEGVYDPCRPNDRLLLGMKGSISEFELSVIRSRMLDAKHGKAHRGELRISVPLGYIWHREIYCSIVSSTWFSLLAGVNLVSMRARLLGSIKWTSAAPRTTQPEIVGGENARDGLEILGWDRQDGSPRCGLGPRRESAKRSSRGLSGLGGRAGRACFPPM